MTWTTVTAAAKTWSDGTKDQCPPAWAQVRSLATSAGLGVDFTLLLTEQYPLVLCEDRPWPIVASFRSGSP